jgi:hypothetical protein
MDIRVFKTNSVAKQPESGAGAGHLQRRCSELYSSCHFSYSAPAGLPAFLSLTQAVLIHYKALE